MDDSAVVIVATIGKPTLKRTIESILLQTYDDVTCLVVVDGPEFEAESLNVLDTFSGNDRVQWVTLPQNTGANGFRCFRIYGAFGMLVNQNYILYCDDDNWFDPDHVRNLVHACIENDLDWCFGMRNIYHEGEFLCRDECESVGLWPAWYSNDFVHVDTNCYCLKRETAIQVAPKWHNARLDDKGNVKPSSDTILANYLTSGRFAHAMVPKFTVNYELGSWELSPRPEFFLEGNLRFAEKHGGIVPWEKIS